MPISLRTLLALLCGWDCRLKPHVTDDLQIHATTVPVNGRGVYTSGASGSGNLRLAFADESQWGLEACIG